MDIAKGHLGSISAGPDRWQFTDADIQQRIQGFRTMLGAVKPTGSPSLRRFTNFAYGLVSPGFMPHCFTQPMRTYASEQVSISCCAMIGKTPGVDEVHCATWPVLASLNTAGVVHAQSASGTIAAASNRLVFIVPLSVVVVSA
jgi:hypothetical protein